MISQKEAATFLEQAERFSAEWTTQAQFIRESFLPQLEALNIQISERCQVPNISRETLTSYMQSSKSVAPHFVRLAHIHNHGGGQTLHYAKVYNQIDTEKLFSVLFPNDMLTSLPALSSDFSPYYNAHFKKVLVGLPKANLTCSIWMGEPVRVYTNYDFCIELEVQGFEELITTNNGYQYSYRPRTAVGLRYAQTAVYKVYLPSPYYDVDCAGADRPLTH